MDSEKQIAGCEGKLKQTRERAKIAARRMRRKGKKVSEYKCKFCHYWHVGENTGDIDREPRNQKHNERPTPERKAKGNWTFVALEKNGPKTVRDMHAHPIDRMQHSGQISPDQAAAAYDYERLYRAAIQTPGTRDSCTLWEPRGHESDDGNVEAVKRYRELCRSLGMIRERQMQWVCVEQNDILPQQVGEFRETLNETCRFFGYRG